MTKDLTQGSPMGLIVRFALPTLLGMLFQQLYNMVDTMIVGKLLGASALAAVGSTGSINFFCHRLLYGAVRRLCHPGGPADGGQRALQDEALCGQLRLSRRPFLPVAHHGHWSALPHDPDRHADSGGHL